MDEITALAAAETVSVLYNTENSLVSKIPYIIIKVLEDKAFECKEEIRLDMNLSLSEQSISEEAQTILSIIYKNYWCDEEKKKQMNAVFLQKSEEYDKEQEEKYNLINSTMQEQLSNEIPETSKNINSINNEEALIVAPKKWYVRIFEKVVRFFRKK